MASLRIYFFGNIRYMMSDYILDGIFVDVTFFGHRNKMLSSVMGTMFRIQIQFVYKELEPVSVLLISKSRILFIQYGQPETFGKQPVVRKGPFHEKQKRHPVEPAGQGL